MMLYLEVTTLLAYSRERGEGKRERKREGERESERDN